MNNKRHSPFSPLYKITHETPQHKFNITEWDVNKTFTYFLQVSNGTIITVSYNSLYQWNDISFTKRIFSFKEPNEDDYIKHLIELKEPYQSAYPHKRFAYAVDKELKVFTIKHKKIELLHSFDNHEWAVTSIISTDPDTIYTSCFDKYIFKYDLINDELVLRLDAHCWNINKLIVIEYDDQVNYASCSYDRFVKVWDALDNDYQLAEVEHEDAVTDICVCDSGKTILSVCDKGKLRVIEWMEEKVVKEIYIWKGVSPFLTIHNVNEDLFLIYNSQDNVSVFFNYDIQSVVTIIQGEEYLVKGVSVYKSTINKNEFEIYITCSGITYIISNK
jgi:WD40 repeat protein